MSELGLGTPIDTRGAAPPRHPRRGRSVMATLLAIGLVVTVVGGVAFLGRNALSGAFEGPADFAGPGAGTVRVEIQGGDSVSAIGASLARAGVIASQDAFVDASASESLATGIQPGSYDMRMEMPARDALALLIDPSNRVFSEATLPEGILRGDSFARLSEATGVPVADFEAAAADPEGLGLPAYAGTNLEGFVFPATYEFDPGSTATDILAATVARYQQTAAALDLEQRAEELGVTPLDIVTVASIIEAEVTRPEDRPKVARVLYNRLAIHMKLQLDSTVKYVVGLDSDIFTTAADRAVKSPYNTYLVDGLPPGPISSPGEAALSAALNPADGNWLYFVVVNLQTSETRFAATLPEHEANVEILRTYCKTSEAC